MYVHLDPRASRVHVPAWFSKQPQLVLQIGLNMAVPIPDLTVDDDAIRCTLSFNRSPSYCVIPWTAVFAMVGEDGRGMVWPDDVPTELEAKIASPREERKLELVRSPKKKATKRKQADVIVLQSDSEKPKRARKKASEKPSAREPAQEKVRPRLEIVAEPEAPPAPTPLRPSRGTSPDRPSPPSPKKSRKRELPPYLRVVK